MQVRTRFTRRQLIMGGSALALLFLAVALGIYQVGMRKPVANPTIMVRQSKGELSVDPWAAEWRQASAVTMPLAVVSTPEATAPKNVQVRALTDGTNLAVRLEWEDTSEDVLTLRPQDFGDAAALQLSDQISQACMGQLDVPVHIWQWKADWQKGSRQMTAQFPNMYSDGFTGPDGNAVVITEDLYARPAFAVGNTRAALEKETPVEHLVAGGFGTLTPAGPHPTQGQGVWQDGKWAVVFTRPLKGEQGDVSLTAGSALQAAFAVWDGKLMQRDGMKYVTGWAVLQLR